MGNMKGRLRFVNYVVDSITFFNNIEFEDCDVKIDFDINPQFDVCKEDNSFVLILDVAIFNEAEKNNYPFEMHLKIVGYFILDDLSDFDSYKANAIAIMYPYVRSLVTSYTANANVNPLVLPVINVNKMIQDKYKRGNNNRDDIQ